MTTRDFWIFGWPWIEINHFDFPFSFNFDEYFAADSLCGVFLFSVFFLPIFIPHAFLASARCCSVFTLLQFPAYGHDRLLKVRLLQRGYSVQGLMFCRDRMKHVLLPRISLIGLPKHCEENRYSLRATHVL